MPQTPLLCKEGNVQKKSKVHSRRSADFLFQKFQFGALAHRDQDIACLNARIRRRIELHHAVLMLDGQNDDAIVLREAQLFQSVRGERTRPADVQLFDFQFEIRRLAERLGHIEKSCHVRTEHRLR